MNWVQMMHCVVAKVPSTVKRFIPHIIESNQYFKGIFFAIYIEIYEHKKNHQDNGEQAN